MRKRTPAEFILKHFENCNFRIVLDTTSIAPYEVITVDHNMRKVLSYHNDTEYYCKLRRNDPNQRDELTVKCDKSTIYIKSVTYRTDESNFTISFKYEMIINLDTGKITAAKFINGIMSFYYNKLAKTSMKVLNAKHRNGCIVLSINSARNTATVATELECNSSHFDISRVLNNVEIYPDPHALWDNIEEAFEMYYPSGIMRNIAKFEKFCLLARSKGKDDKTKGIDDYINNIIKTGSLSVPLDSQFPSDLYYQGLSAIENSPAIKILDREFNYPHINEITELDKSKIDIIVGALDTLFNETDSESTRVGLYYIKKNVLAFHVLGCFNIEAIPQAIIDITRKM